MKAEPLPREEAASMTPVVSSDDLVGDGKAKARASGFVGRERHERASRAASGVMPQPSSVTRMMI